MDLADKCQLRPVRLSDAEKLYQWASSADVRENAINQEIFPYDSHLKWLANRVQNSLCKFYILECQGMPVGQLRIENIDGEWILDYSVDRKWRGRGLGSKMIELFLSQQNPVNILAQVAETNAPSIKVFEKLGFSLIKRENINGRNFILFKKEFIDEVKNK